MPRVVPRARHQADPVASRCSRSSPSSCSASSATTCTPPAVAASSTRSAPTPTPPYLYGLQVRRRVRRAFVLCGALAGLAGVVYAARYGTVSSGAGTGIELQAVAPRSSAASRSSAAAAPSGARRSAPFLLVTINRALPILGIPDFWQRAVVGALIIGADRPRPGARGPTRTQARGSEGRVMSAPTLSRPERRDAHLPGVLAPAVAAGAADPRVRGDRAARRGLRLLHRQRAQLRRPADALLPVPRHGADPADRAADDADHHHRRDRPVGGQRGRAEQRAGRHPAPGRRPVDPGGRRRRDPGRRGVRRLQRLPGRVRRPAVAGRHDRHPRALPRHRRRPARHQGGHRLPREVDRPRQGADRRRVELPDDPDPVPRAR